MKKKKILVVEDDAKQLSYLKETFEKKGYTVLTADTAEAALLILKQDNFKVMFFNLGLPGMNGLNLCREVRNDHPEANIYAVTGMVTKYEFSTCFKAGFDGYFRKPVSWQTLYETAEEIFSPEIVHNP